MEPKMNKNANTRIEWYKELESDVGELTGIDFLVDGFVSIVDHEMSSFNTDNEVDIIQVWKRVGEGWAEVPVENLDDSDIDSMIESLFQQREDDLDNDYWDWVDSKIDEEKEHDYDYYDCCGMDDYSDDEIKYSDI